MSNELIRDLKHLKYALMAGLLTALFCFWFYVIDVKYNPVIQFTSGVDEMNFQLTKDEYAPGEMVQGYTAFCKKRNSAGSTLWTLANGKLVFFTPTEFQSIPKGCYPQETDYIVFDIKPVPIDAISGETMKFTAINYQKLWGGRIAETNFQTETFIVK